MISEQQVIYILLQKLGPWFELLCDLSISWGKFFGIEKNLKKNNTKVNDIDCYLIWHMRQRWSFPFLPS